MPYYNLISKILIIIITILFGIFIYLGLSRLYEKFILGIKKSYNYAASKAPKVNNRRLKRWGCPISGVNFSLLKIAAAIAGFIFGCIIGIPIYISPAFAILFYFIPDLWLFARNRTDNELIDQDMYYTYMNLIAQMSAGTFITEIIRTTEPLLKSPRLIDAMQYMRRNITSDGVKEFSERFDNEILETYTFFIKNFLANGTNEEYVQSLFETNKNMLNELAEKDVSRMESKMGIYKIGFMIALLLIIGYASITILGLDSVLQFFA